MKRRTFLRKNNLFLFIGMMFVFSLLTGTGSPAAAYNWSPNLLKNPDAETGTAINWEHTVRFYVTEEQYQVAARVYPHAGKYFFSMAQDSSSYGKASQDIDISAYDYTVDNGDGDFESGVWMQNESFNRESAEDSGKLTLEYMDASGVKLGEDATGEIYHKDGNYWKEEKIFKTVPKGTRTVRFILEGFCHSGSVVNSFFDDAYFRIKNTENRLDISGKVLISIAGYENLPVINAPVVLEGTEFSTVTDKDGNFLLKVRNVPEGTYHLKITSPKLQSLDQEISISEDIGLTMPLPAMNMSCDCGTENPPDDPEDPNDNDETPPCEAAEVTMEKVIYDLQVLSGIR